MQALGTHMDDKYLRYIAANLAKRKDISFEEAKSEILSKPYLYAPDEFFTCPECGVKIKGKKADKIAKHRKRQFLHVLSD